MSRQRRTGKTGLLFFPAFDWAIEPTHPEREERLLYTRDLLLEEGVLDLDSIAEYGPRLATDLEIARAHICVPNIAAQVTEAHRAACGGALTLADAWAQGQIANGFALVQPPGHHAMRVVHGNRGFCNLNTEAVVVAHLRRQHGVQRVAIVDTDVHHGDGTQDIFYHDPAVLVIGLHQDGRTLYPGTGFIGELGGPGAFASNLNVPLPPGTGDEGYLYVMKELVLPILEAFQPDVVINSAGQDAHYSDPLARMRVSAQGYARLTRLLAPDLAVLEGGYAVQTALPYVNLAVVLALAGLELDSVREPDYDPRLARTPPHVMDAIREEVALIRGIWENPGPVRERLYPRMGAELTRSKQITYDTDQISEEQQETVRCCEACPGWVQVESRAHGPRIGTRRAWAISIPPGACSRCNTEAHAAYEAQRRTPRAGWDWAYLQNAADEEYRRFAYATEREVGL